MSKAQINLLPPEQKIDLKKDLIILALTKFVRTLMVGLVLLTGAGLATAGWIWWQSAGVDDSAKSEVEEYVRAYRGIKKDIDQKNKVIDDLRLVQKEKTQWAPEIAKVLDELPSGIQLHSLRVEMGDEFPLVEIVGQADTRNTLVVFEQRLQSEEWIAQVQAPRSNLLQPVNSEFTLILLLNKEVTDNKAAG